VPAPKRIWSITCVDARAALDLLQVFADFLDHASEFMDAEWQVVAL